MKCRPIFIAVVHVSSDFQAENQTKIAFDNGADGIFLIDHGRDYLQLETTYYKIREKFSENWIGINFLDLGASQAIKFAPKNIDGLWMDNVDDVKIKDFYFDRNYKLFAGTAFKYQKQPENLEREANLISKIFDVVTTSGVGTGKVADLDKIKRMKMAIGEKPLAIASGITNDNIENYLPFVDCFLVSTGISKSFFEFDPKQVRELSDKINTLK